MKRPATLAGTPGGGMVICLADENGHPSYWELDTTAVRQLMEFAAVALRNAAQGEDGDAP